MKGKPGTHGWGQAIHSLQTDRTVRDQESAEGEGIAHQEYHIISLPYSTLKGLFPPLHHFCPAGIACAMLLF